MWGLHSPRFDWVPESERHSNRMQKTCCKCTKTIMCQQLFVFEYLSYNDTNINSILRPIFCTLRLDISLWFDNDCLQVVTKPAEPIAEETKPVSQRERAKNIRTVSWWRQRRWWWWWWWWHLVALPENPLMLRVSVMHSICIAGFMLHVIFKQASACQLPTRKINYCIRIKYCFLFHNLFTCFIFSRAFRIKNP